MQGHPGKHQGQLVRKQWEQDEKVGKILYCGLLRKEKVKQGKQPQDWLALIILAGCGVQGLSLVGTWPWGDQGSGRAYLQLEPGRGGRGDAGSGLVGLCLKCVLKAESFTISKDWLTLGEAFLQGHPDAKASKTHD